MVKNYSDGHPHTMYVTDYSINTSLFKYKTEVNRDWPGPFGNRTLQLGCWDQAAYQARKCRVGEIYHFRNVNTKMFASQLSPCPHLIVSNHNNLHLEGRLNPDGHKVLIDTYVPSVPWLNGGL